MISSGGFRSGVGGGLCQLANMVHWLLLNSPLTVTELHHHSDALFPDERRTVPFGTGHLCLLQERGLPISQHDRSAGAAASLVGRHRPVRGSCTPPSPSLTAIESSRRTADLSRRRMAGTGSARFTEG